MADLNQRQERRKEQQRQQEQKKECEQTRTINDLPAEIICEIAKYDPASSMKLGLTCKNFNGILQKDLKKIQKIAEYNKKLEKVEWAIGNLLELYEEKMDENEFMDFWDIMSNVHDNAQCINCRRFKREIGDGFHTRYVCGKCAYRVFNDSELKVPDFISNIFIEKRVDVRVVFDDNDNVNENGYKIYKVIVLGKPVKLLIKRLPKNKNRKIRR